MSKYLSIFFFALVVILATGQITLAKPELQRGNKTHYVTWGESLESIAVRYGVTVESILRQNGLTNPDLIYVGQLLIIPDLGHDQSMGYNSSGCVDYHIVSTGETLSSIAWNYNTTVQALLQHNNLYNKDFVYVGQKICLPGGGYRAQPASYQQPMQPAHTYYYHTVMAGETLSSIAYRYGVNYWDIVQANNLSNASFIWTGQQLIIPGYQMRPQTYDHSYAESYHKKPPAYKKYDDSKFDSVSDQADEDDVPAAPGYQPIPASAPLSRAKRPVEVVVNGGENWVGQIYPSKLDPDGITTLIVQTGEENGKIVRVRSGDSESKGASEFTGEFGAARFVYRYISPGDYDVWVDDPDIPSQKVQVEVDAGERVEVFFRRGVAFQGQTFASPDGWFLADWKNPSEPGKNLGGWSNILVKTPASGLWVVLNSEGGYQAKCFTGSKGPGACDFAALGAGIYYIHIDGTDLTLKTYMDGNAYAEFTFARQSD